MLQIIARQVHDTDDLADGDFWHAIKEIMVAGTTVCFRCVWIPSHCNDKGNEVKRQQMLDKGLITEAQINGNDQADELAKQGAAKHQVDEKSYWHRSTVMASR